MNFIKAHYDHHVNIRSSTSVLGGTAFQQCFARIFEGLIFVIPGMFLGAIVNVIFSVLLLAVALVAGLLFFIGFPVGSLLILIVK